MTVYFLSTLDSRWPTPYIGLVNFGNGGVMDGREFFNRVTTHEGLEYLTAQQGATPAEDVVIVRSQRLGMFTLLSIDAILDNDWDILLAVMLGHREAKIMKHVTRIVGYYSELRNWNPSKIAELADRHRGTYGVPEQHNERKLAPRAPAAVA